MKLLTWNVRGLGRIEKCRAVKKLLNSLKPVVVMLQELKLKKVNSRTFNALRGRGRYKRFAVELDGASGSIITMWQENFFKFENSVVYCRSYILINGRINEGDVECGFGNVCALVEER